jgi:anti-sigma regulatory factor (Ser/Thr protein kinase)
LQVEREDTALDAPGHIVQFYERDEQLYESGVPFLARGLALGEAVAVIAGKKHRDGFVSGLRDAGVDVDGVRDRGDLLILDAERTMAQFMVDGHPDAERFDRVVGSLMREAAAGGQRVRAYGEMVAVLWDQGLVGAAIELEELWNALARELEFLLYCAYATSPGTDAIELSALEAVCGLHTALVENAPSVLLATGGTPGPVEAWRVFPCQIESPTRARRFVVDALERWGCHDVIDDAALVVTELTTNAVAHARSAFTVNVRWLPGRVAITVHDASHALPRRRAALLDAPSGRGLHLIATVARTWGARPVREGKVVWAELRS